MKKIVLTMLVVAMFIALAPKAEAKVMDDGKNDRKGFFIGFGLGGGMTNLSGGGDSNTKGSFISDIKIGGGITDKILLMYDGSVAYTKISGVNFYIFNFPVAAQWYVWKDLYIRPGFGMSYARASTSVNGTSLSTDSKVSFGADFAAGYEFRFGKYFALSPELVYHYSHIRSNISNGNAHSFGGQASMVWFF